ncbi:RICIN domain-containing protein [Streptosporangium sandarakinum]|uniref:RICIN domain-containing protein n=1 Tax=Streptosporangium sandarakinum TaxID=1260955 RepID=UPI003D91B06E
MRSSKRAAAVLSAAALLLLPALPAEAAMTFTFGNLHSGKCLEVAYSGTADLADVGQYTCHSGNNQKWYIQPAGGGWQTLVNVNSGKCLDVLGWSTADFATVTQYTCHGGANQKWELVQVTVAPGQPNNRMMLRNQNSGKCLEILNYSTADFGEAVQYGCYEGANQVWASPQWFWPT